MYKQCLELMNYKAVKIWAVKREEGGANSALQQNSKSCLIYWPDIIVWLHKKVNTPGKTGENEDNNKVTEESIIMRF